jgi:TolB-like protein
MRHVLSVSWFRTLFMGLCFFVLSCGINGAEKVTVAVLDFDSVNSNELPENIHRTVPEWLSASLVKANRFHVLERNRLQVLLSEKLRQNLAVFDQDKVGEYSSLIGANAIVYGSIIHRGSRPGSLFARLFSEEDQGAIEISAKVVDLATGEIILSDSTYANTNADIQAATDKLGQKIVSVLPLKGFVLEIQSQDRVILDVGLNDGISEGAVLVVAGKSKTLIHPVTGESVTIPEKHKAEILIEEVHLKTAIGKLLAKRGVSLSEIQVGDEVQSLPVKTFSIAKNLRRFSDLYASTAGMGYVGLATSQGGSVDINPAGLAQLAGSQLSLEWKYTAPRSIQTEQNGETQSASGGYSAFNQTPGFPSAMNFSVPFGNGFAMGVNMYTDTLLINSDTHPLDHGVFNYSMSVARAINPHWMLGASLGNYESWHKFGSSTPSVNYTFRGRQTRLKLGTLLRPNNQIRLGGILSFPLSSAGDYTVAGVSGEYSPPGVSEWGLGVMYSPLEYISLGLDLIAKNENGIDPIYETHMGFAWNIGDLLTLTAGTYLTYSRVPNLLSDTRFPEGYGLMRQFTTVGVAIKRDALFLELGAEFGALTEPVIIRPDLSSGRSREVLLNAYDDLRFTAKIGTSF